MLPTLPNLRITYLSSSSPSLSRADTLNNSLLPPCVLLSPVLSCCLPQYQQFPSLVPPPLSVLSPGVGWNSVFSTYSLYLDDLICPRALESIYVLTTSKDLSSDLTSPKFHICSSHCTLATSPLDANQYIRLNTSKENAGNYLP